jgi:hypothetical protein
VATAFVILLSITNCRVIGGGKYRNLLGREWRGCVGFVMVPNMVVVAEAVLTRSGTHIVYLTCTGLWVSLGFTQSCSSKSWQHARG